MKKSILVTIVVLTLSLVMARVALADGGPHGGYTSTTDACAGCHRAHTAIGPRLLMDNSTYDLCISCHGNAGTGADSNVLDGIWLEGRNPTDTTGDLQTAINANLLGGGFNNYGAAPVTSSHDPTDTQVDAWGYGVARGALAALSGANPLSCASCHDPHGSPNYRIIPETVNGVAVAVALVDEGAAKDYDDEQWGAGTSAFCAACHDDYHQTAANQGSTLDGASYTHRINMPWDGDAGTDPYIGMGGGNPETVGFDDDGAGPNPTFYLPLAESGVNDTLVCMTCHLPHGSSAEMIGNADGAGLPGETSATDSALLRLDNRGVCQVCHQK